MPLTWEARRVKASLYIFRFQLVSVAYLLLLLLGPTTARGETCGPPPAEAPLPKKFPEQWKGHHFKADLINAYMNHSWASLVSDLSDNQTATYRCARGMGLAMMDNNDTAYIVKCLPNGTWPSESHKDCVHKPLSAMYPHVLKAWQSSNMTQWNSAMNCIKGGHSNCKTQEEKNPWWMADLGYAYETTIVWLNLVQQRTECVLCNAWAFTNITVKSIESLPSSGPNHNYLKKPEGGSACANKSHPDGYKVGSDPPYLPFVCGLGEEKVRYIVVSGVDGRSGTLNMAWVDVWGWECPEGFSGDACSPMCGADGCQHGGNCMKRDVCTCAAGFTGLHCETNVSIGGDKGITKNTTGPSIGGDVGTTKSTANPSIGEDEGFTKSTTNPSIGGDKGIPQSTANPSIGGDEGFTKSTTNPSIGGDEGFTNRTGNNTNNVTKTGKGPERFLTPEKELVWGVGLGMSVLLAAIGIMVVAGKSKEPDEEQDVLTEEEEDEDGISYSSDSEAKTAT